VLLPSPLEVAQTLWAHLNEGNFVLNVYMSVQRVVLGLLLGMLLAVPIGFMIGWYRPVRRFVDPLISFFRALPPIALIPLAIVYLGIGEVAKVALAAGENMRGQAEFTAALKSGAFAVIQPDLGKWGGFSQCVEVGRAALRHTRLFCPHWLGGEPASG